jgi:ubiquinone/menaquinone biosynthesis C-methylase UbiE
MRKKIFALIDKIFTRIDKNFILRNNNIHLIPGLKYRKGGKVSYAEWAHVIGIFQTVFYNTLDKKSGNKILDIGCGTGLLGIAAQSFITEGGKYTGIDVINSDINFDIKHFDPAHYEFIHFDLANPTYAKDQSQEKKPWPIQDSHYDMVTALSVWTHLKEDDAIYYFKEVKRVLKKGGKAVITFFILDKEYESSLAKRTNVKGRYHSTPQTKWIFDKSAYASENWFAPNWVQHPEDAIGVTKKGLDILLETSGLNLVSHFHGNWKEKPGLYFQDVLILEA